MKGPLLGGNGWIEGHSLESEVKDSTNIHCLEEHIQSHPFVLNYPSLVPFHLFFFLSFPSSHIVPKLSYIVPYIYQAIKAIITSIFINQSTFERSSR